MIVKVAELDKSIKSSFKRLTEYITCEQVEAEQNIRNIGAWLEPDDIYDIEDLDLFIDDVEHIQSMSNAKSDKTYHMIVSFGVDERPDSNTLKAIFNELIDSLGFVEHQRITVIHNDTDNLHMHIAINKIHPEKYTIREPFRDYKILSEKASELEIKYDLSQTHNKDKNITNTHTIANNIDARPTQESFKTYVSSINLSECKSWEDFHDKLKENGVLYKKYGSGAVFKDLTDDKINIKASAVKREYSLKNLENKYGEFRESKSEKEITKTYNRYKDLSLKEQYDLINTNRKLKSRQEKQVVKNEYLEASKPSNEIIDNLSRMAGGGELDKLLIKMYKKTQEKARRRELKEKKNADFKLINKKYKYFTYDAWLQNEALTNEKAETALKRIKDSRINYIKGDFKVLKEYSLKVTKNGTYILNNNLKANKQSIFITPKYNNIKKAIETLKDNKIIPDTINGTEEYKNKVIDIIAAYNINISFKDEDINQKILATKIFKNENIKSYIKERNDKINTYESFKESNQEYIFQGYEKYNDKFLLKFKSITSNTIYIKEPVKEDYTVLKDISKGSVIKVTSEIKNSYDVESLVSDKEIKRFKFKELDMFDEQMKRVSTKEYNGEKIYIYKKENDNTFYVSKIPHIKSKEEKIEKSQIKNKDLER